MNFKEISRGGCKYVHITIFVRLCVWDFASVNRLSDIYEVYYRSSLQKLLDQ
jgi:hypothetical protein